MKRASPFQSAGAVARVEIWADVAPRLMHEREVRLAEVFIADLVRTRAILVAIVETAPPDGMDENGVLYFPPAMLPRLYAAFDLRAVAGRNFPGAWRELVIVGVRL